MYFKAGGAVINMSRHCCSAASRANRESVGPILGPSQAARPASPPRLPAARAKAQFCRDQSFCRPARRNGGPRRGAAPRRVAAPTLFASRAGTRVADTRICRHALRAATLHGQFFT